MICEECGEPTNTRFFYSCSKPAEAFPQQPYGQREAGKMDM